ncbi:orf246 (mitochondrion) [Beta vulgaris subsp. vulgaris]|uniref:Orf246 protein n=1 Tax=Beta vulgaris subsp. vulgaris TaxID=3555 RepID=Q9MF63_BETVV|nr:orf246 [Beta vulgaris subsp. vulgaris]BAA99472.1 orf246 [Beta vulgaris subsp. vulgaris]
MARKGNPISVRLDLNRSSDSSWFNDYYYGKLVYQDLNLRSYVGSIRPPTRLTFGSRPGRCIIIHCQKRTFINFFLKFFFILLISCLVLAVVSCLSLLLGFGWSFSFILSKIAFMILGSGLHVVFRRLGWAFPALLTSCSMYMVGASGDAPFDLNNPPETDAAASGDAPFDLNNPPAPDAAASGERNLPWRTWSASQIKFERAGELTKKAEELTQKAEELTQRHKSSKTTAPGSSGRKGIAFLGYVF